MAWIDESVGNNDILPASCGKDNNFGNIFWGEGFDTTGHNASQWEAAKKGNETLRINGVCLGFVAVEADNGEFLYRIADENLFLV